jgi:hypothetical protein
MEKKIVVALYLMLITVVSVGCRTVWVHPDASHEKYTSDFYRCRFGTEPPTPEEIEHGELPTITPRRDWKQCMALLGWRTKTGMRSSPPHSR